MRIVGTGVDLVEVERLRRAAERRPALLARLFTPAELAYAAAAPRHRWQRLAARFAAKEALLKALGTGLRQVRWQEAEVVRDEAGRPGLVLAGALARLARERGVCQAHLSLSHTPRYAVAQVVLVGGDGGAGCDSGPDAGH